MSSTGGFSSTRISAIGGDPKENNYIWTTEKINQLIDDINNGVKDIRKLGMSPFKDNDINLRRENLPFEYTPEEIEELSKCKASVMYFALNYCLIATPKGRLILKDAGGLRDFQEQILKAYKENPLNILMASRQTGKCLSFNTLVTLYDTNLNIEITLPIFELYFSAIKELRKLTTFEKIKYKLYKIVHRCQGIELL
jgi:hypothetical protein